VLVGQARHRREDADAGRWQLGANRGELGHAAYLTARPMAAAAPGRR
jgi:hypothetical protein